MDPTDILPAIERLDDGMDELEDALKPLMKAVSDVASKLPLLDKAKLYVLVTYSLESMLFSALRLNEVDAKEHPVFKELKRVRQYFDKIKNIENPPSDQKREQTLNKEAAIRFIRSDLAENKEVHSQLTEMIAKERAKASLKNSKIGEKRKLDQSVSSAKSTEDSGSAEESEEDEEPIPAKKVKSSQKDKFEKKKKRDKKDKKHKKSKKNKSSAKD
ncbi:Sas10/Utp3/C1D family-domain-containing protein [Xylariaceae sp. FL0255]|nr:Sas10/Utp3/C1D family-domain-containing protein [Xylariaceae sp. FL0255]